MSKRDCKAAGNPPARPALPRLVLAGNPNVGKSTVFNALTGLRQHTGNWPGKTVTAAEGVCRVGRRAFLLTDIPGAYSLRAQSAEEEAALEAIAFGGAQAVIVVCDAGCLERNLNLVFQILEITPRVVVAVNLMDEAEKKGITVRLPALENALGVPAVGICARKKQGFSALLDAVERVIQTQPSPLCVSYPPAIENALAAGAAVLKRRYQGLVSPRFAALRLMERDACFRRELEKRLPLRPEEENALSALAPALPSLSESVVDAVYARAEAVCRACVTRKSVLSDRDRRLDRLFTGPVTGYLTLLLLLLLVFFITLKGANIPSAYLSSGFEALGEWLGGALSFLPPFWHHLLMDGVFRTLTQVICVMLPPMAIFFPLFTLLEDSGYLPRAAFTLDGLFEKSSACGKQALTMCMGFGCNAVGVEGCRIIDSPRERLIAILTNNLVPCNGRFPTLIVLMTLFFTGGGAFSTLKNAAFLLFLLLLSLLATLLISRLLSRTLLRGESSSFTLELPPYRMPQIGKTLVRSLLDRTLFVLGRAAAVAAPAGLCIYLLSSLSAGGVPILRHITDFLSPLGRFMGLDGVILAGFLLGIPANEIVLPLILMGYTAASSLPDAGNAAVLGEILRANGWTALTALNLMLFSLFHFPCSTTLLTVYKETRSVKWTFLSALLPTALGVLLCVLTTLLAQVF